MRHVALFLLLALLMGGRTAHAGDDDLAVAKAAARTELMREANLALSQGGTAAIAAMQRGLAADAEFLATLEAAGSKDEELLKAFAATIAERRILLGDPPRGVGDAREPGTDGALHEAATLRD